MMTIVFLLLTGLALSAFFSGSETGFYRASRVRLVLDGLSGDLISRVLLWLVNNPAVFVATILVGNNVANYLLSLSCVLAAQHVLGTGHPICEVAAPIVAAPFFFIYGELLPKYVYFLAPNRLLKASGPAILAFAVISSPILLVLWLLGKAIHLLVGESPENIQMRLARAELQRVLDEGRQAGVLRPSQRLLAKTVFDGANATVADVMIRPFGQRVIEEEDSWITIVERARRYQVSTFAIRRHRHGELLGYVRLMDAYSAKEDWQRQMRPLLRFQRAESQMTALLQFHTRSSTMAQVLDDQGHTVGLVTPDRLASHPSSWEST